MGPHGFRPLRSPIHSTLAAWALDPGSAGPRSCRGKNQAIQAAQQSGSTPRSRLGRLCKVLLPLALRPASPFPLFPGLSPLRCATGESTAVSEKQAKQEGAPPSRGAESVMRRNLRDALTASASPSDDCFHLGCFLEHGNPSSIVSSLQLFRLS